MVNVFECGRGIMVGEVYENIFYEGMCIDSVLNGIVGRRI